MKYLIIKDNRGYFWDGIDYKDIDKINKENLLKLLDFAEQNDFELDSYDIDLLGNRAHQIIYENISKKIEQFIQDKERFKNEVNNLYKEAIEKYSAVIVEGDDLPLYVEDKKTTEHAVPVEEIDVSDIPF